MRIIEITGSGAESNIFAISDEKLVVIDSGSGQNFSKIERNFEENGISVSDVDILINTHHHYDHIGGNYNFVEKSNCKLMTSERTAKLIEEGDNEKTLADRFGTNLKPLKVSRILSDGDLINTGESNLKVISTPGHTDGDICLYDPDNNLLFSGDTIFKRGIGRLDLPTAKPDLMSESIGRLLNFDIEKIYPGHGPIIDHDAEAHIKRALKMSRKM